MMGFIEGLARLDPQEFLMVKPSKPLIDLTKQAGQADVADALIEAGEQALNYITDEGNEKDMENYVTTLRYLATNGFKSIVGILYTLIKDKAVKDVPHIKAVMIKPANVKFFIAFCKPPKAKKVS